MDAERRSKRYASDHPLLVRCESWAEFVQLYAGDIGQGGMFILMDEPPPILSRIEIRMMLPEATEVHLSARIVHVSERTEGKLVGVGVEFLDVDAAQKRQIQQLIEFARWQGMSGDPHASFARTLLESSPSLPPTQLGAQLSATRSPVPRTTPSGRPVSERADTRKITLDGTERTAETQSEQRRRSEDPRTATHDRERAAPRDGDRRTSSQSGVTRASSQPVGTTATAPPSDPAKLTIVMATFKNKRYDHALTVLKEILEESPTDAHALKWQSMCMARIALTKNDQQSAAAHYEKALSHDESNREAREFVRNYDREKRLKALPFGRYFTSKKK